MLPVPRASRKRPAPEHPPCVGRPGEGRLAAGGSIEGVRPLVLLLLTCAGASLPGCVLANSNLQEVEPARFYRSGQMSAARLEKNAERLGIRTVINLRGHHPEERWWREEAAVTEAMGIAHHDLSWSARRLPDPGSLDAFVQLVRTAEAPILVHCQGGVHRAAVASAIFLLLEGHSVRRAREEFGIFFLDAEVGALVDLYEGSALPFATWAHERYPELYEERRPAPCESRSHREPDPVPRQIR